MKKNSFGFLFLVLSLFLFACRDSVPPPSNMIAPTGASALAPTSIILPTSTVIITVIPTPTVFPVEMVMVPEGEFTMGSNNGEPDEQPVHQVYLSSYYIDKYEVTNALYKMCIDAGVCALPGNSDWRYNDIQYMQHPIVYVDWYKAKEYCEWRGARLPTEAEWEKAARGTDERTYPWGEKIDETFANYDFIVSGTTVVGNYLKGVSPYGLYDMSGNVWELVSDRYDSSYYANSPTTNPLGSEIGDYRVIRGGSWDDPDSSLRAANRDGSGPLNSNYIIGFRCARDVTP